MDQDTHSGRQYVIGGMALLIVVAYIVRLAFLQLATSDYREQADHNAFYHNVIYPSRGNIFDRNGELLVYDQPAYDLMVIVQEARRVDTLDFCRTMGITRQQFDRRMADIRDPSKNPGYSPYKQQVFMTRIPAEQYSVLQEKLFRYPGFYVRQRSVRCHLYPQMAHLLGYVSEASPADIERDPYYAPGDYIGKSGVERSYEADLRGEKGLEVLLRDARGGIQGHYRNGTEDSSPVAGRDLTLSIDLGLQQLGERLMEGKVGAIVAIQPQTGEVLCMVSSPTYDPRMLEGRDRGQLLMDLGTEPLKPLLNRAIQGTYPPGSTFKTSQGLTFLQEGIITEQTLYGCSHGFICGGMRVGCHGHGAPLPLIPAIATSCNGYFCWGLYHMLGDRRKYTTIQDAMTTWKDYMVSMGFGYRLGVDLPGENRGLIPNASFYDKAHGGKWTPLSVISIAIGQGEVLLTPLQIANLGATIANRGYYITPHVVREVRGGQLADSLLQRHYTMVDSRYYEMVVQGMRNAVLGGTCRTANSPYYAVCGKTGTAQNPHGQDHSAFMGFAPMDDPQIAICVYVENGRWGATYGVPIGALMIEQYLRGELSPASQAKADDFQRRRISYADVIQRELRRQGRMVTAEEIRRMDPLSLPSSAPSTASPAQGDEERAAELPAPALQIATPDATPVIPAEL